VISSPSAQSDSAIFWVLEKGYARTDFDAKYVKRRGSPQGLLGVAKPKSKVSSPIFLKTAILNPLSTGLGIFFRPPRQKVKRLLFFFGGGVLEKVHRRDARTGFPRKGVPFGDRETNNTISK